MPSDPFDGQAKIVCVQLVSGAVIVGRLAMASTVIQSDKFTLQDPLFFHVQAQQDGTSRAMFNSVGPYAKRPKWTLVLQRSQVLVMPYEPETQVEQAYLEAFEHARAEFNETQEDSNGLPAGSVTASDSPFVKA